MKANKIQINSSKVSSKRTSSLNDRVSGRLSVNDEFLNTGL